MKKSLFIAQTVFSLLLFVNRVVVAQVANAGFEDRYQAPRDLDNISPVYISPTASPIPSTDLKVWYHPGTMGGNSTGISDTPDYIASDGATRVNPVTYYPTNYGVPGFSAHNGISCIEIYQQESPGVHGQDEFITQKLPNALQAGHLYHASFWALRAPGSPYSTKLALSITNDDPIFDHDNNTLQPSPGRKVIVSGDIQQRYVWTKVEGDILIPGNESNNQWLTIGYDRSDQVLNYNLQNDYPITGIIFAIDDVSLDDMGCATPKNPGGAFVRVGTSCYYDYQILAPTDRTSYNIQLNNGHTGIGYVNSTTNGYMRFGLEELGPATVDVTITATSVCGATFTATNSRVIPATPKNCTYRVASTSTTDTTPTDAPVAYPNPASESITIPENVERASLISDKGKVLQQVAAGEQLTVKNLPDGLYNLQMMQNGKLINQRIQVKH